MKLKEHRSTKENAKAQKNWSAPAAECRWRRPSAWANLAVTDGSAPASQLACTVAVVCMCGCVPQRLCCGSLPASLAQESESAAASSGAVSCFAFAPGVPPSRFELWFFTGSELPFGAVVFASWPWRLSPPRSQPPASSASGRELSRRRHCVGIAACIACRRQAQYWRYILYLLVPAYRAISTRWKKNWNHLLREHRGRWIFIRRARRGIAPHRFRSFLCAGNWILWRERNPRSSIHSLLVLYSILLVIDENNRVGSCNVKLRMYVEIWMKEQKQMALK